MKSPDKIEFNDFYNDNSGVAYSVRYENDPSLKKDPKRIIFEEYGQSIWFPYDKLDWLIEKLEYIKKQTQ